MYISRTTVIALIVTIAGCSAGWVLSEHSDPAATGTLAQLARIADSVVIGAAGSGDTSSAPVAPAPTQAAPTAPASVHSPMSGRKDASPSAQPAPPIPTTAPQPSSTSSSALRPTDEVPSGTGEARRSPQGAVPDAPLAAPSLQSVFLYQLTSPPFFAEQLFRPLPGVQSRGVAFSEWESYRTDVAGRNILVTTDDSNYFKDRNGKINANTGDTDASGLNVVSATDSVIFGSESADEAPYQTAAAALVDLASGASGAGRGSIDDDDDDEGDENSEQARFEAARPLDPRPASTSLAGAGGVPFATAMVMSATGCDPDGDDCTSGSSEEWDFPYSEWVRQINGGSGSAIHTDEGTTMASGGDAVVIGADGYDDNDNRAVGENITITRDDGNVVVGGTGPVNAQIGDSEQGAVIMDVTRTYIHGGGAY